jgi:UDP-N-acetylglucosamine transferase subunit ALG13
MIFLTIGTQVPFDRLVKAVDEIAPSLHTEIIAQVSKSAYKAQHIKTFDFIAPHEFDVFFNRASLIVSHAGMGNIISALEREKPILVMPRLARYGEHRNDHQMATARVFEKLNYVHVAYDEHELQKKLLSVYSERLQPLHKIGNTASPQLIASIKSFIGGH